LFIDTAAQGPSSDILVKEQEIKIMLWTIFVILMVLWLVGLVSFHAIGLYVHLLLIAAIVVLLIRVIGGGRVI
jgi:hypothetical protein